MAPLRRRALIPNPCLRIMTAKVGIWDARKSG
jgi:hypothetical protein